MSLLDIEERASSSFCFTSPSSLFSFSFVLVSSRIPTAARLRGESDWSTGSQTQIISSSSVSITRRILRRSSTRRTIIRKEHHRVFQSRSRIKNPEAEAVSQQLAQLWRCLVPTERDNVSKTNVFSRNMESRSVSVINESLTDKKEIGMKVSFNSYPGDAKTQKKSPLYFNDDHMSLEKCWVAIETSEVQRTCGTPWQHCQRWLRRLCCILKVRIVCVTNDCDENHKYNCKIYRLWRSSIWCSICIYADNTGRCFKIAENSEVRMFRRMDTSSKTQMMEIMIQYGRSRGFSWTEPVCSSFSRTTDRTIISRSFIQTWMGKKK